MTLNIKDDDKEVTSMVNPSAPQALFAAPDRVTVVAGPSLRSGVPYVTGFMPAGVLVPNFAIPYFDSRTRKGYQRPPQDARINELASDLRKGRVDLPTSILLNLRNNQAQEALSGNQLNVHMLRSTAIVQPFYVVDGQHRVLALKKLIEEFDENSWSQFLLPFVCLIGATEEQEMDQFYIVNSKAKAVRTDLAYALLKQRAERDPNVMEQLTERGKDWTVRAEDVVEVLAESCAVWRGLIRFAAMEKGPTVVPSASMVSSLRPLLTSPFFGQLAKDQQVKILDAYWRGLRDLLPEAFDSPSGYVLQKGMGVMVLHSILVQVLEIARTQGTSVTEPGTYTEMMRASFDQLQGENAAGDTVGGIEFWQVAPHGAAGSFSSSAGRRVLLAKIRQHLPVVEVQ